MQPSAPRGVTRSPAASDASKTGTPAPYGHACTNCAKAKCKCIHRNVGGACERCFRLNKECKASVPNRKRNPRKTPGSRTAHLEEKLDDLVSLIRSQTTIRSSSNANNLVAGTSCQSISASSTAVPPTSSVSSSNPSPAGRIPGEAYSTAATSPTDTCPGSEYDYLITPDVAETNLALFRRDMLRRCPMLLLPPNLSSRDFRQAHPILWLSIMACASQSVRQANAVADKLRQIVATKVVQGVERSLDLLQGMMVFLQWPHCHTSDKPWMSFWTNLAVALAQDLGFTTLTGETAFTYIKKLWLPKHPCRQPPLNTNRTMEERRTILALYVWTTNYSQMARRDNPLRWTQFMEQSLRTLMDQPEWEGDSILAAQVRAALVGLQIADLAIQQALSGEIRIPMYFHQALSSQLEELRRTLAPSLVNNETVLIHLHGTEVAVHEMALNVEPSTNNIDTMKRLKALRSCLTALENFFQTWNRIAPSQYMGLTFNMFVHLLNSIVALFRLSTLDNIPGWDPTEATSRVPLFAVLDHVAEQMAAATSAIPIADDEPPTEDCTHATVWAKAERVMRLIKQGIKRDFPHLDPLGNMEPVAAMPAGSTGIQVPPPDVQDPFFANFADDPWLSAIFVPWDSMNF